MLVTIIGSIDAYFCRASLIRKAHRLGSIATPLRRSWCVRSRHARPLDVSVRSLSPPSPSLRYLRPQGAMLAGAPSGPARPTRAAQSRARVLSRASPRALLRNSSTKMRLSAGDVGCVDLSRYERIVPGHNAGSGPLDQESSTGWPISHLKRRVHAGPPGRVLPLRLSRLSPRRLPSVAPRQT